MNLERGAIPLPDDMEIRVYWGLQGEPYQVPCLVLTLASKTARVSMEQRPYLVKQNILVVDFDEYVPEEENPLPVIDLPAKDGYSAVRVISGVRSPQLARIYEELYEAVEAGKFQAGREVGTVTDIILE